MRRDSAVEHSFLRRQTKCPLSHSYEAPPCSIFGSPRRRGRRGGSAARASAGCTYGKPPQKRWTRFAVDGRLGRRRERRRRRGAARSLQRAAATPAAAAAARGSFAARRPRAGRREPTPRVEAFVRTTRRPPQPLPYASRPAAQAGTPTSRRRTAPRPRSRIPSGRASASASSRRRTRRARGARPWRWRCRAKSTRRSSTAAPCPSSCRRRSASSTRSTSSSCARRSVGARAVTKTSRRLRVCRRDGRYRRFLRVGAGLFEGRGRGTAADATWIVRGGRGEIVL